MPAIDHSIPTEAPVERAVLVSAPTKDVPAAEAAEHLEELARLTDTAGAVVVGTIGQRLDAPHPRLYIGEGKAHELKQLLEDRGAKLAIFDEELSPAQGKNLEDTLKIRVMDRAELILDIFATRARTREAQMQVELAQLQYMLPRLKRMWTHLTRGGGIGFRGPGETQLETDRRLISRRIRDLRGKLKVVSQRRATQRKGRSEMFRAALVGYTNAGKSSILRALSGADVFVEDRLFATLDAATRQIELDGGQEVLLTDTVGFIRKLPHHLVASFRATLEEAAEADLLLHVIDASHSMWEEQKDVVEQVLGDLDMRDHPTLLVFNKTDRLTHAEEELLRERARAAFVQPAVFISAQSPGGLEELRTALLNAQRSRRERIRVRIPARDGEALASVYREGEVLEQAQEGTEISLVARVPAATLGRLRQRAGVIVESG